MVLVCSVCENSWYSNSNVYWFQGCAWISLISGVKSKNLPTCRTSDWICRSSKNQNIHSNATDLFSWIDIFSWPTENNLWNFYFPLLFNASMIIITLIYQKFMNVLTNFEFFLFNWMHNILSLIDIYTAE